MKKTPFKARNSAFFTCYGITRTVLVLLIGLTVNAVFLMIPAAFLSARNVEADSKDTARKMPNGQDLKTITMEELKGTWRWYSTGSDEVHGVDFFLSFTGNNLVLNGGSRGSMADGNCSIWTGFYYLSDTIDETFDVGKLQNNQGRYIVMSDIDDVMNAPTTCMMVSKDSNSKDTLVAYFKTRFPDSYATLKYVKKDTLYPQMIVPVCNIAPVDSTDIICADSTSLIGQWQIQNIAGVTVNITAKGMVDYTRMGSSNNRSRKRYNSFYYLSDSPDSHFDMNKMLSDKGKYIIVKNVFYYNEHYNNDTFVFPINKVGSDTAVISCPLNDMGKLILKRE